MIKLTFLKELMLIKQVHKRSAILFTIGSFKDKGFQTQLNVCNGCHDLLMITVDVKDIAILKIQGVGYRFTINEINKNEGLNLLQNADLTKISGTLQKIKELLNKYKNRKIIYNV